MDIISTLPLNIIETILCFLPIQDAARTSILSREWRYHWIKIPKLSFIEETFQVSTDSDELSDTGNQEMIKKRKLFDAIDHILQLHEDPIHEFTLSMVTEGTPQDFDCMMFLMLHRNTIKKLKLEFVPGYTFHLGVFASHPLTDLHLVGCSLYSEPLFEGFANLSSLYIQDVTASKETLLLILSGCPLLKNATLDIDYLTYPENDDSTVINLFEYLTMVENLTLRFGIFEYFALDDIPQKLSIALVHLKYLCLKDICFIHSCGLLIIALLIKNSPNLEKLKLEILDDSWVEIYERRDLFTLEDDSNIWLEHLNELEIVNMIYRDVELDFVKLILAKSPALKKVRILLYNEVAKDEELQISEIFKQCSHASSVVDVVVEGIRGSCTSSRCVM
ncbi:F-box/FBD/LRR-repeat protein At1g13570-like [Bidens hawaiensis]|uniref:F-box/FBD/LRR-repeat protein At1g13570-like n=1 Tax=Bidens hawaiensis TaxID=980011 RepID=UPI00404B6DDD